MFSILAILTRNELLGFFRSKSALFWALAFPILLLERNMTDQGAYQRVQCLRAIDADFSAGWPQAARRRHEGVRAGTDVRPEHALMVGDASFDLLMARNAGIDCVAVGYGAQSMQSLLAYEPRLAIEHFSELRTWLGRQVN